MKRTQKKPDRTPLEAISGPHEANIKAVESTPPDSIRGRKSTSIAERVIIDNR